MSQSEINTTLNHTPAVPERRSGDGESMQDCLSIAEFCRRNSMSVQMFYKTPGQMPETFRLGTRRLITREAAARWRLARDAEAAIHGKQRERESA